MEPATAVLLTAVLGGAVVTDLCFARIPNWLTVPAMLAGLCAHAWEQGAAGAVFSVAGLCAGLALFLPLYLAGPFGAGDVKLLAAVGAMVGVTGVLLSGMLAMVMGGVYALGVMSYHWGIAGAGRNVASTVFGGGLSRERRLVRAGSPLRIRYALAVAGGTVLAQLAGCFSI